MQSRKEKEEHLKLLEERERRRQQNKINELYPDHGKLARKNYPKHLSFFSSEARERLFLAANRVGKSYGVGGYEVALHLTGKYPKWWKGRRFDRPTNGWVAGQTNQTTRDICQLILLGDFNSFGTGLIPGDLIKPNPPRKAGIPEAYELLNVKHVSGGWSTVGFKAYDQKRKSFEGTSKDFIWMDEEPPLDVYTECVLRTMTTDGLIILTFTPLLGMSEVVMQFLTDELKPKSTKTKFSVGATWDDAPHLSQEAKDQLWEAIPLYQREARSKGIPQLGSGAIYPIAEEDVIIPDFIIPKYWPKLYGMDVGWNKTAAVWMTHDRENDVIYIYAEYFRGQAEPSVHSDSILARGVDIPGLIDPASRGRSQVDGKQLLEIYTEQSLNLIPAINAVEAGIYEIWVRFTTGRLRIFQSCVNLIKELRLYRRDEKGRVVKENDHGMDCLRYGATSIDCAVVQEDEMKPPALGNRMEKGGWMR